MASVNHDDLNASYETETIFEIQNPKLMHLSVLSPRGGGGPRAYVGHFIFTEECLVKISTLGPEKWVKSDQVSPSWASNFP